MLTRGHVLHRGLVESPSGIKVKIKHIFIEENFTMKKLILSLVLCLSVVVVAQGGIPITVVNPGFEDPCFYRQVNGFDGEVTNPDGGLFPDVPGWEDDATAEWVRSGVLTPGGGDPGIPVGDYAGFLIDQAAAAENVMWQLTGKTIEADEIYTISLWASGKWTGQNMKLSIFSDDGMGNHTEIASEIIAVPGDQAWHEYSTAGLAIGGVGSPGIGDTLGIAIEHVEQDVGVNKWMSYDEVRLEQVLAYNPDPCDGEPLVAATTNLEWDLAAVVTNCDVYFGSDPNFINNPKVVDAQNVELYDPPVDLDDETTYYWRVDARVDTTVYEGDIWEFTTITADPILDEDPCGLTINAGETAVFRVKATNVDSYSWQKLGGGEVGTDSTLTITNVQKVNEGVYWCELKNEATTIETAKVNLMTRRLVALWEFEDDLTDSEADGWDGDYTDPNTANDPPTPVFVLDPCSIDDGKSLQLVADELHVRITGSENLFNFYPQGYTVNAWVKTEQDADYGCMASKQHRVEVEWPDWDGWVLNCTNTGVAAHGLRQVFGDYSGSSVIGTSNIADNEWHMVTATYNGETGTGTIYVDGLLENQLVDTVRKAPTNDQPVIIGAETILGEVAYEGLLDKTSIYSYALDQVDVALLYTDVMGGNLCVGGNPEYDLNDDCKVNILDFALFAADWLECNIVPDCLP
jgi:Concanavalin A-like lectin/glucanases superfamily